jgi:hypothetical protein
MRGWMPPVLGIADGIIGGIALGSDGVTGGAIRVAGDAAGGATGGVIARTIEKGARPRRPRPRARLVGVGHVHRRGGRVDDRDGLENR